MSCRQDHGGTKFHDACCNVATTKPMLDLLWNDGELDVNAVSRSRTMFWHLIDAYFQTGVKYGFMAKSNFALQMAHDGGNTPLHHAAKHGLVDVTDWLLEHGAHKSLLVRNDMGATPLDSARIFGPHPAIEAKLGAAMLNHQFGTQFAIRRGSLLRQQAGRRVIEPEHDGDVDSPSDESHPAELSTQLGTISNDESDGSDIIDEPGVDSANSSIDGTAEGAVMDANTDQAQASVIARDPMVPDSLATFETGAALSTLSSGVEARLAARFDEQAARSNEHTARFDEQAARLDALQFEHTQLRVQNTEIMAKLDVLLAQQQPR